MAHSPDLSSAISMHPIPLAISMHSPRSEHNRLDTHTPIQTNSLSPDESSTTAYEATTPPREVHDPISRHTTATMARDIEGGALRVSPEHDPYGLQLAYKTDSELDLIRANMSRKRDNYCGTIPLNSTAYKAKKVEGFYKTQNEKIESFLKPVDDHRADARAEAGENQLKFKIAVYGSFAANVLLAALQVYAASSSGSLSLFTTMADAIFDPLSNITLIVTNRAISKVDPRRFPSGKARLETAGNIAFCFIMSAVSFIITAFSIQELANGSATETTRFHLPSVIAVAIAFLTKFSLFCYCWSLKDKYSQIMILWQDHRNDLIINGFGLMTSVMSSYFRWWIDPMGAIILSVLISAIWLRTAFAEFMLLVGVVGSLELQQLITYLCITHSDDISAVDTVRCYHSGPRLIAEVDIVMDPEASLRATHDVAEDLQIKIESLPDIERAYVHVDYETTHKPEHAYKKVL